MINFDSNVPSFLHTLDANMKAISPLAFVHRNSFLNCYRDSFAFVRYEIFKAVKIGLPL